MAGPLLEGIACLITRGFLAATISVVAAQGALAGASDTVPLVATDPYQDECEAIIPQQASALPTRNVQLDDLGHIRDFGGMDTSEAEPAGFSVDPAGRFLAVQVRQADSASNSYCQALLVYDLLNQSGPPLVLDTGGEFVRRSFTVYGLHGFPTGTPEPLTPKWSTDGSQLAFLKRDAGITRLYVMTVRDGSAHAVSDSGGDVVEFEWSSAGTLTYSQAEDLAAARQKVAAEGRSGHRFDERFWTVAELTPYPRNSIQNVEHTAVFQGDGVDTQPLPNLHAQPDATGGETVSSILNLEIVEAAGQGLVLRVADKLIHCPFEECAQVSAAWKIPNEKAVIFMRREGFAAAQTGIYRWRIDSATLQRILVTDDAILGCDIQVRLICAHESSRRPRDIVEVDWDTGVLRPLVDLNPEWSALKLGSVTRLYWHNKFGIETFGDLVLPPGLDSSSKLPLVIVQYNSRGFLRGGTGDEYPIQAIAAAGFAVLSFNRPLEYQTAMQRAGRKFSQRNAIIRWTDRESVHDSLLEGIKLARMTAPVDQNRIAVTGLSDGASTATYALIHSNVFSLALLSSCCEDPEILETNVGPAYLNHIRRSGYPLPWERHRASWQRVSLAMNAKSICAKIIIQSADREARLALASLRELKRHSRDVAMYVFPDEYHVKWQPVHRRAVYVRSLEELQSWKHSAPLKCPS